MARIYKNTGALKMINNIKRIFKKAEDFNLICLISLCFYVPVLLLIWILYYFLFIEFNDFCVLAIMSLPLSFLASLPVALSIEMRRIYEKYGR